MWLNIASSGYVFSVTSTSLLQNYPLFNRIPNKESKINTNLIAHIKTSTRLHANGNENGNSHELLKMNKDLWKVLILGLNWRKNIPTWGPWEETKYESMSFSVSSYLWATSRCGLKIFSNSNKKKCFKVILTNKLNQNISSSRIPRKHKLRQLKWDNKNKHPSQNLGLKYTHQ